MDFINSYLTYIVTVVVLVVVLIGAMILLRNFGGAIKGRRGQRLGVTEYYELDKLRRLVLIRRDDVEHLLLIGGNQDMVVESRIGADDENGIDFRDLPRSPALDPARPVARPAPRPPVFADRPASSATAPVPGQGREEPRMR